jgi:dual specificity tyrosine-phosphorylation-regulated kinase 2/3/4
LLVVSAGEDETEQLLCIMEIMGLPPGYLVDSASRRKVFFDSHGNPTIVPNSRGATAGCCIAVVAALC